MCPQWPGRVGATTDVDGMMSEVAELGEEGAGNKCAKFLTQRVTGPSLHVKHSQTRENIDEYSHLPSESPSLSPGGVLTHRVNAAGTEFSTTTHSANSTPRAASWATCQACENVDACMHVSAGLAQCVYCLTFQDAPRQVTA